MWPSNRSHVSEFGRESASLPRFIMALVMFKSTGRSVYGTAAGAAAMLPLTLEVPLASSVR